MSKHYLDRHFREKLANQSADVPAGLWDAIQTRLPDTPATGSRSRWFWVLLLAALVLGTSATYLILQGRAAVPEEATALSQAADSDGMLQAQPVLPTEPEDVSAAVATDRKAGEVGESRSQAVENRATSELIRQHAARRTSPEARAPLTGIASGTHDNANDAQLDPASEADVHVIDQMRNATPETRSSLRPALQLYKIASLSAGVGSLDEYAIMQTDCYSFGKRGLGHFEIDLYGGPSYATKSMTSRNEDVSDYIMSRDTTEFKRLGFHLGARIGYHHPTGFFARIGAQYTQLNERFDYENGSSTQTIITTDTIFDAMGNVVDIVLDTVVTTGTRIKKTYNRFHLVDIPILLGYQIDNLDWAYGIQAGPVFNVAFARKGDILAPNGVPGSFSDEQSSDFHPVFKDQLGLSVYASVYAQRRIGERLYGFVEPHVLHRLKSITLASYPIDQRQTAFGLSFGVRMTL